MGTTNESHSELVSGIWIASTRQGEHVAFLSVRV